MKTDISNKEDIKIFVDAFYSKVQSDDLIGPIFGSKVATEDWPMHLEKMYSFWNTVLFGQKDYVGNPFSHHINLPIDHQHFARWMDTLQEVVQYHFVGIKADEVINRAQKMRLIFEAKLKDIRDNPNKVRLL